MFTRRACGARAGAVEARADLRPGAGELVGEVRDALGRVAGHGDEAAHRARLTPRLGTHGLGDRDGGAAEREEQGGAGKNGGRADAHADTSDEE